jgi:glucosamine-6-phosphate deaminase
MPDLASGNDPQAAPMIEPDGDGFRYGLARFISFRDAVACARARRIPREALTRHANPDLEIQIVDDRGEFYRRFALDLVDRVRSARDAGRRLVVILPVGPLPQYPIAAGIINRDRLDLRHVHTFNMDEYANEEGETAPVSWPGSFQRAMWEHFFGRIDPELRMPESQIHFPTRGRLDGYADAISELGGADVCYGGIGWGGHVAFWEPQLGAEFAGDLDAYRRAGPRLVELHPMTIMQNALHSFGGDWSWVPPKANTIGPAQVLGARHRSFWLDGDLGGGVSWQRFIARLVLHGPVSEFVPGSLLQTAPSQVTLLGGVADDVQIRMS